MSHGANNNLQTGGSAGHPKGQSLSEKFRTLITADDQHAVITAMVTAAKEGDAPAAEVVLERLYPKPRPIAEVHRIPGMREAVGLVAKAQCVVDAIGNGDIPAEYGRVALAALADAAKIVEVGELAQRIAELEAHLRGEKVVNPRDGSDLA